MIWLSFHSSLNMSYWVLFFIIESSVGIHAIPYKSWLSIKVWRVIKFNNLFISILSIGLLNCHILMDSICLFLYGLSISNILFFHLFSFAHHFILGYLSTTFDIDIRFLDFFHILYLKETCWFFIVATNHR